MERRSDENDRIWDEALDLILRLQNDPANPVTLNTIGRWRRRSPAHEAVWTELCQLHDLSGRALAQRRDSAAPRPARLTRRSILAGSAAAAAAGVAALLAPPVLLHARADHLTGTAEVRAVTLPDGSTATLGPDSAIRLAFTGADRTVELLAGMGFFEVVPDRDRAFRVVADRLTATARGTAFEVSSDAGYLTVSVDHGQVDVNVGQHDGRPDERLGGSEWLTFDERSTTIAKGSKDPTRIAAWRNNLIFADRETIASLVARIARWRAGRIVIADPSFGSERVSGVYDLTHPLGALEAVVTPFGGHVRTLTPYLTVVSRF